MVLLHDPRNTAGPPDDVDALAPKPGSGPQKSVFQNLSCFRPGCSLGFVAEITVVQQGDDALAVQRGVEVGLEELAAEGAAAGLAVLFPPFAEALLSVSVFGFFFFLLLLNQHLFLFLLVVVSLAFIFPHGGQRLLHQRVHHRRPHGEVVDADFGRGLDRGVALKGKGKVFFFRK